MMFIGRQREIEQFHQSLSHFGPLRRLRTRLTGRSRRPPCVFLPQGIEGIGKTWLARRCLEISLEQGWTTLEVDWGKTRLRPTEPLDVMDAIAEGLRTKYGSPAVNAYRATHERIRTARDFVRRVTTENFAKLQEFEAKQDDTGEDPFLSSEEVFLKWAIERGHLTADDVRLYQSGGVSLAQSLCGALIAAGRKIPLVVLLDSCEMLSVALEDWLRDMIVCPAVREPAPLLFIIAGEKDQFSERRPREPANPLRSVKGYADRLTDPPAVPWDLRPFSEPEVRQYLKTYGLPTDDNSVALAQSASQGIPYALWTFANTVHGCGRKSAQQLFPPSELSTLAPADLVRRVTSGFLRHCLDDPDDLRHIYFLALLRHPDLYAVTQLWGLLDDESARAELARLRARYAFVDSDGHLHGAVSQFIKDELRDSERSTANELGRLASEHYGPLWQASTENISTLRKRWATPHWCELTLQYLNALLWHNSHTTGAFLADRFLEAMLFDQEFASALLDLADPFGRLRDWWSQPTHALLHILRRILTAEGQDKLEPLDRLLQASEAYDPDLTHRACIHCYRAEILLATGQPRAALAACLEADKLLPNDPSLKDSVADLLCRVGWKLCLPKGQLVPSADAETAFERAIRLATPASSAYEGLGVALLGLNRPAEAVEALIQSTNLGPGTSSSYIFMGRAYLRVERYEDATQAFRRATALDAKDAVPHAGLGDAYRNLQRYEEAITAYLRAVELDAAFAGPHVGLGDIYYHQRRVEKAKKAYQRAIEVEPTSAPAHNGLGDVYHYQERLTEAIAAYQHAISLDQDFAPPHCGMGNVYHDQKKYNLAIGEYLNAIALDHGFAPPHNGLGNVYRELEQYDLAKTEYRRATALDPSFALPRKGLGDLYHHLGRLNKAIEEYRHATKCDPNLAEAHTGLGNVLCDLKEYRLAIAAYQRAIAINSHLAGPHVGLGNVFRYRRQCAQAIAAYRRAVEIDPQNVQAYRGRGWIHSLLCDFDRAGADLRRAVELDPEEGWVYVSLANVYRHQGADSKRAECLQEAERRIPPDDDYAQACLASVVGDVDAAIENLSRALELNEDWREWARDDPDLFWIRNDPRYDALLTANKNPLD